MIHLQARLFEFLRSPEFIKLFYEDMNNDLDIFASLICREEHLTFDDK